MKTDHFLNALDKIHPLQSKLCHILPMGVTLEMPLGSQTLLGASFGGGLQPTIGASDQTHLVWRSGVLESIERSMVALRASILNS